MTFSLSEMEAAISRLDDALKLIARQRIDLSDPAWLEKMASGPHPLDRVGVRADTEEVLAKLSREYARGDPDARARVRSWMRRFDSFAWATLGRGDRRTPKALREELIRFSLLDQGKDPRDAKLWLEDLLKDLKTPSQAHIELFREIAALASEEDRYGWGSTRSWLEDAADRLGET